MVVTASHLSDPRFALEYSGGVTSRAAIFKAMAEDGPLIVAQDHVMAQLLPNELDDTHAPKLATTQIELIATCITCWRTLVLSRERRKRATANADHTNVESLCAYTSVSECRV